MGDRRPWNLLNQLQQVLSGTARIHSLHPTPSHTVGTAGPQEKFTQVRGAEEINITTDWWTLPLLFDYYMANCHSVLHRVFTRPETQPASTRDVHSLSGVISDAWYHSCQWKFTLVTFCRVPHRLSYFLFSFLFFKSMPQNCTSYIFYFHSDSTLGLGTYFYTTGTFVKICELFDLKAMDGNLKQFLTMQNVL